MRIWLIGITSKGHKEDLQELIDPIKDHFDGLVWTFHYPLDDGYDYLEEVKGEGEIIKTKWCNRMDFSRNHCLYQGPMKMGDWFLTIDTLERLSTEFTKNIKHLCNDLDKNNIDGAFLYNKRFLFKLNEHTAFINNPHEGIQGCKKTIELSDQNFWQKSFQKNVRQDKRRDPFHFVEHNFKYYLYPNTNHLLLGFEDNMDLVKKRYENRAKFIAEIYSQGFDPFNLSSVEDCLRNFLSDQLRECIDFDKFLNDWYRYKILEQKDGLIDKHDFSVFDPIF